MDAAFLTTDAFWHADEPFAPGFPGTLPGHPGLREHVLFQTSGTSGAPRWIALSKRALLVSARVVNTHLGVGPEACWGLALPLHHVGGFGVVARARAAGCACEVFGLRWQAAAFAGWLHERRVTHLSLVPTQVHDLVAAGLRAPTALRAMVVGGGRLDESTGQAARALGWPVLASYGMTEAGSQIATQETADLGRPYQPAPLPLLPGWRAEVTASGLLRISGDALFSGTLLQDGNGGWRYDARTDPWYESRDRAALDGRWLTPLGRADAVVKILGELVDPEAVERELAALADGQLAAGRFAVIAVPDPRAGHALVPVLERGAVDPRIAAAALSGYEAAAPGFQRLRAAVWLDQIPRSPLGKVRRAELAALMDQDR